MSLKEAFCSILTYSNEAQSVAMSSGGKTHTSRGGSTLQLVQLKLQGLSLAEVSSRAPSRISYF